MSKFYISICLGVLLSAQASYGKNALSRAVDKVGSGINHSVDVVQANAKASKVKKGLKTTGKAVGKGLKSVGHGGENVNNTVGKGVGHTVDVAQKDIKAKNVSNAARNIAKTAGHATRNVANATIVKPVRIAAGAVRGAGKGAKKSYDNNK